MAKKQKPRQQSMFCSESPATRNARPVTFLGLTFPNDEERRKYFLEKMREKPKDSEFRQIEEFPISPCKGHGTLFLAASDKRWAQDLDC